MLLGLKSIASSLSHHLIWFRIICLFFFPTSLKQDQKMYSDPCILHSSTNAWKQQPYTPTVLPSISVCIFPSPPTSALHFYTLLCFFVLSVHAGAGTGRAFTAATEVIRYCWSAAGCTTTKVWIHTHARTYKIISTYSAGSCLQNSLQSRLHVTREPWCVEIPAKPVGLSDSTAAEQIFLLLKSKQNVIIWDQPLLQLKSAEEKR